MDEKAHLRSIARRRRLALHAAHPDAPLRAMAMFRASAQAPSKVAAVYRALGSELDPAPLAAWFAAHGARVVLPVTLAHSAPLVFREADGRPLVPDAIGAPAPQQGAPEHRPEVVLVPLLAFDRRGGRLGQGGGYYDRTLAALRAHGPAIRAIGFAYAGQEVERVPVDALDQRLDGVLTESAYLDFTGDD